MVHTRFYFASICGPRQAATFPGCWLLSLPQWGRGGQLLQAGEAGMMFPSLGRAGVMAVLLQAWSTDGASAFK